MRYRIGLDLGTNSIGWAVLRLMPDDTPRQVVRLGVRLFPDGRNPKDKQSLAVARRQARQMRRRRDRYLKRRERFMDALIRHGLLPQDSVERQALVNLDPYELRAKGLDEALPLHHLGRALFHLNQRRGFKSNRKVDKAADQEAGKIKGALSQTEAAMQAIGARTAGEWLWLRHKDKRPVRARLNGQGAKASYELYVGRDQVAAEFDRLWEAQRGFHGAHLSDTARDELRDILLHQRELKPVIPGKCTFEPDDRRAPLALPSTQRFRIYQELNHLRILGERYEEIPLTRAQRDKLATDLLRGKKRTFEQMVRALRLPPGTRFNLESDKRTELKGDATAAALGRDDAFGERWHHLSLTEQDAIVERLLEEPSETVLVAELMEHWALPEAHAIRVANLGLPEGYGRLGRKALGKILPELMRDVVTYDAAVAAAGYSSHSDLGGRLNLEELPYYGRVLKRHVAFERDNPRNEVEQYGRLANPTVHIALNQMRGLVNAIIRRYGKPEQIVVEVTRDLKNGLEARKRIEAQQKLRQQDNDRYRRELAGLGLPHNAENIKRLRLWEELNKDDPLNRCCVYTGEQISVTRLFSDDVEIEHLLPFARTLDDSQANQTVSLRRANRFKGNRTPFEAFGASTGGYDWQAILQRAGHLPENKQWRFAENALERFLEGQDFLARQLNDTAYLSRIAKQYLESLFPEDGRNHVWVTPGRLTSLLRGKWGLNRILSDANRKERTDHRHHAVDAAVIAVTDRALLKQVADAAQRATETQLDRIIGEMPLPWQGYRREVKEAVERIRVSYKPDHGVEGRLHNDTAYGLVEHNPKGPSVVVHRVPVTTFGKTEDLKAIRDTELREELHDRLGSLQGKEFQAALARWSEETGVRRVRVMESLEIIPIRDREGHAYKAYKGDSNYAIEIWRDDKGRWRGDVITTFEANQMARKGLIPLPKDVAGNGKPLVMRLCKDDTVLVEEGGRKRIMRVVKFSQSGQIALAELHESGNLKERDADKTDEFKYLLKNPGGLLPLKARRVTIDFLGILHDPGFTP